MPFLLRSIGDFIPVKMEFITVKFWPYGQPISRPANMLSIANIRGDIVIVGSCYTYIPDTEKSKPNMLRPVDAPIPLNPIDDNNK